MTLNNYEKAIAYLFESMKELRSSNVLLSDLDNDLLLESIELIDKARLNIVEFCKKKDIHYAYAKAEIKIEG